MKPQRLALITAFVGVSLLQGVAYAQNPPAIFALAFSPDGKRLAVGTHGRALLVDVATFQVTDTFNGVREAVRSLAFHPDGDHIAVGSGTPGAYGDLLMWSIKEPEKVRHYAPAKDTVERICFAADGSSMLTAAFDNKARFYPHTFYGYGPTLEEHNGRVTSVAMSPKKKYIFVTGAMDKMVKVWDFKTQKVVVNFDQSQAGISGLAFLNNGDQFVSASRDGSLYWFGVGYDERRDSYGGYHFRTVGAHDGGIWAFGASTNGQRMITAGIDKKVKVWRVEDGGLVKEFAEPKLPVYAAALSPDGKIGAAAGREGVVWIWDVETGKLLTTFTPPPMPQQVAAAAEIPGKPVSLKVRVADQPIPKSITIHVKEAKEVRKPPK